VAASIISGRHQQTSRHNGTAFGLGNTCPSPKDFLRGRCVRTSRMWMFTLPWYVFTVTFLRDASSQMTVSPEAVTEGEGAAPAAFFLGRSPSSSSSTTKSSSTSCRTGAEDPGR